MYLGILTNRVNRDFAVISDTREMAEKSLVAEYTKLYVNLHGFKPSERELEYVKEEISIEHIELNKVITY